MTKTQRSEAFKALGERYGALASAFTSAGAGEPNAQAKVKEAYSAYSQTMAKFTDDEDHPDEAQDKELIDQMLGDDDDTTEADADIEAGDEAITVDEEIGEAEDLGTTDAGHGRRYNADQEPEEESYLPDKDVLSDTDELEETIETPPGDEGDSFSVRKEVKGLRSQLGDAVRVIKTLQGRQVRKDFEGYCAKLVSVGHQFDTLNAMKMFKACTNVDQIKALQSFLKGTPKKARLTGGPTFGVKGQATEQHSLDFSVDTSGAPEVSREELSAKLRRLSPGTNFSDEDYKIGEIMSVAGSNGLSNPVL